MQGKGVGGDLKSVKAMPSAVDIAGQNPSHSSQIERANLHDPPPLSSTFGPQNGESSTRRDGL